MRSVGNFASKVTYHMSPCTRAPLRADALKLTVQAESHGAARLCTNFTPTQITPDGGPPYSGKWLGIGGLQCLDCGDAPFGAVTTAGTR